MALGQGLKGPEDTVKKDFPVSEPSKNAVIKPIHEALPFPDKVEDVLAWASAFVERIAEQNSGSTGDDKKVAELEAKVKQLESDVAAKQKEFDDLKKSGRVFDKRSFHPGYEWCRYYLIHFWYNGKEIHIKDQPQAFKHVYGILSSNKDGVWKSEDLGFPSGQAGVSITIRFYVYWKPWSEYSSKHLEYNAKTGDSYTVKELYPEPNF